MTAKFYAGYAVLVVAKVPGMKGKIIVKPIEDLRLYKGASLPADMLVDEKSIEPLIYDVFSHGDHVRNKNGSMVGKISGFELHTNKAVLISDKIDKYEQKRTRYVYGLEDLELVNDSTVRFVPGVWYRINDKYELFAVQSVFNKDEVMLFNADGQPVYKGLPKTTNVYWLNIKHSISSVE